MTVLMTNDKKKNTMSCSKSGFTYMMGKTHGPVNNPGELPADPKPFDQCLVNGISFRASLSGQWKMSAEETLKMIGFEAKFKYTLFKQPLGYLEATLTESQAKVFLDHQNVTVSEIELFSWMYPHDAHILEPLRSFVPNGNLHRLPN